MHRPARPWGKCGPPFWTTGRRFQLMEMIEQGMTSEEIAKAFGVTVFALNNARTKYGVPSHRDTLISASRAAEMIGMSNPRSVTPWIRGGYLPARRTACTWWIHPDDFEAFLEDPRYWNLWDVALVKDPTRRARLTAMRDAADLVTTAQAAEIKCCTIGTVQRWVREGRLRPVSACKGQGRLGHFFRRADVLAMELPPLGAQRGVNPRTTWKASAAA